jgi:outer membrane protein assembly factor BamB
LNESSNQELSLKPHPFPIDLADAVAPAHIVASAETHDTAMELRRRLQEILGVLCPVVGDAAITCESEPAAHIIAVGNMANNAFIRACYHRYWCLTDRSYPGPGGWEVRTIATPWGGTRSIVLCGGSDATGTRLAADRLAELAASTRGCIGPTIDVQHGEGWAATIAEIDTFEATALAGEMRFGISNADELDKSGTYYYLTGRRALGLRYREAWRLMAGAHPERVAEEQIHLRMCWRVLAWDLLSDTDVFSDGDRELVGRYIAEVLDGREGAENPGLLLRSGFVEPRQNHETHIALLLIYGARYLRRAFENPAADRWEAAGRHLFQVYNDSAESHWKPVEDNFDHAFAITMVDALDASLCFAEPHFVTSGNLRRAAELAMAGCGNRGFAPIIGDADGSWPRELLAAAASLYNDGRYAWMAQLGYPTREFNPRLQRRWADDVAPVPPADLAGLQVQPLDRIYYDLPAIDAAYAEQFYVSPPNVPHHRTFDKLTLRSGLGADDQYILIDGVAGGSHSFDDTLAIHAFDQSGKSWIVPEDNLHWPQQTHHSLVTIVRDGQSERIPTFADLSLATGLEHSAFVLSQVHNYAGAQWRRGLVWRRGDYLLVLDEVEAYEPGNYTIETRYRTLGDHCFAGDTFTLTQGNRRFHIGWDDVQHAWGEPVDVSIAYQWDPELVADRHNRYGGIWPLVLTMLHLSTECEMQQGDRVTIASVLGGADNATAAGWTVRRIGRMAAWLQRGDEVEYAGLAPDGEFRACGIDFRGSAFRIGARSLSLTGVTCLALAGEEILSASDPVDVEFDSVTSSARLYMSPTAQVTFHKSLQSRLVRVSSESDSECAEYELEGVRWDELDFTSGLAVTDAPVSTPSRARGHASNAELIETVLQPTCCSVIGDTIAVGGTTGEIALLDTGGDALWKASMPGEVLTIAGGDLEGSGVANVVAGGTGCAIHAFTGDGKPLWVAQPEFGSQFWIWWTLGEAQIHRLVVDDIDGDGRPEVLAGVSNMRLHCYDATGRERWQFRTDHGVFKTFVTCDIDSDGKKEIIGGCDLLSSMSTVRVVDAGGSLRHTFWNQGWTAQVRSLLVEDIDNDGKLEVCCGTNREDCLRVHWTDGSGLRWSHNLADSVTGIGLALNGSDRQLVAGSRSFYVSAFDPATGNTRWTINVSHAVTSLLTIGSRIIVGTEDGRVLSLDFAGRITSETQLAGPIAQLAECAGYVIALGQGEGLWRLERFSE